MKMLVVDGFAKILSLNTLTKCKVLNVVFKKVEEDDDFAF